MSHNYSYRRPPPAKGIRPSSFDSPDHLHPGDHSHNVYRSCPESPSHSTIPSYPYSSSRASAATESPYSSSLSRSEPYSSSLNRSDQTLLSSCGLKPKDLSLLAEMPEDLITVENLPHLVLEIKKKRATQQSSYPAMISYPPAVTSRPPSATPPPGCVWELGDRSHSQPLDIHPSLPPSQLLPTEQAEPWQLHRHGNSMQYTCSRLEPVPVQVVDYHYGKETRRSYQTPRSTYNTAQGGSSNTWKPPNSSQPAVDYRYPPTTDYRPRPDQDVPVVTIKMASSGNTPTKKSALDFHGEIPQTFPHTCSLCDITVLSEKFWFTHANGTQHADGQLTLLKMYPEWDCRMQTTRNGDDHTKRPNVEEKTGGPSHRLINYMGKPSSSGSRESIDPKTKGSGKVVCAKFTARCLNEDGLKDLINPFGEVVKIIMFPALAFVEMGSTDQAADIVTYYLSNPVTVKGGQVTFSVSSTFNFLQSSRVLSFSPVPPGKESSAWKRQLLAAAKRFGPVEHSLFLPTQAFVEMTNPLDAQKLVGHHTSKHLKIDEIHIKVAFSSEYNTLPTISDRKSSVRKSSVRKSSDRKSSDRKSSDRKSSDRKSSDRKSSDRKSSDRKSSDRSRKSEDRSKRKRSPSPRRRNLSPRRDSPTTSKRRRSRERDSDRHKERVKSSSGGKGSPRSPSKQISCRNSRSPRSHTKERVSSEKKTPGSGKTDLKKNKVSPSSTRSQPPTKDKTPSLSSNVMEKSEEAVVTTDQSKKNTETQENGATEACDMDSDIEGMAVYGEDGEENSDMGEEEEEEGQVGEKEGEVGEAEVVEGEEEEEVVEVEEEEVEEEESEEEESEEEGELGETQEEGQVGEEEEKKVGEEEEGEKQQESAEDLIQELSATRSEQGKAFSATGSEQGEKRDGEDQKADASYVDEEEHDFPECHENHITLGALKQDSSADGQDNQSIDEPKSRSKRKPSRCDQTTGRVIYVKNLPRGFYTDSDFLKIVKGFGRVHRYYLLGNGEEGFIEMERSSDVTKALRELRYDGCKLYGQRVIVLRSQKYKRLTTGWKPESDYDSKSDQKKDHRNSRSSSRIRRWISSHSKSAAKDKETKEEDEETKKEDEETKEEDEETKEEDEETARQVHSEQRSKQSSDPAKHFHMDRGASKLNTDKLSNSEDQNNAPVSAAEDEKRACSTEDNVETKMEDNVERGPDYVKTGMESLFQPNNPVGREFITPVMGYFCNLCQVVYVNEDEAKNQHCSSLCHYLKFMEHSAKDTASS